MALNDRWLTTTVVCKGGLVEDQDRLTQGTALTGTAVRLQNMEPALEGGYERILGYTEYDSAVVPGQGVVLGVQVYGSSVLAARLNVGGTAVDVYTSIGSGWTKINTTGQDATSTKYRGISYSITTPVAILCDGKGPALKWDGSSDTVINGTGTPTAPKFAELHYARLVLAQGSIIYMSAPSDDEEFDTSSGALVFNVGDTITAIRRHRGELYIFCTNSIFKLIGNSTATFVLTPVTRSIGCVLGDSVQELGGDLVFLSSDGFRSIAATDRIGDTDLGLLSRAIQPSVRSALNEGSFNEDEVCSLTIRGKSQYRCMLYSSGGLEADAAGFLGKLEGDAAGYNYEWATLKGISAYSADSAYDSAGDEIIVFGHPTTGKVYSMESGNSFNGADIEAIYQTPDMTFGAEIAKHRKVVYDMKLVAQPSGTTEFQIDTVLNRGCDGVIAPPTIIVDGLIQAVEWDNFNWDGASWAVALEPIIKKNLIGSGITVGFVFYSKGTGAAYRIDSFNIEYSVKGRR